RFCRDPNKRSALLAAATVALAHLCKSTALLLRPALIVTFIVMRGPRAWRQMLTGIAMAMIVTWFGINLCYGFWRPFEPLGKFNFDSQLMRSIQAHLPWHTPVPLAREYVIGFDAQKFETAGAYPTWLLVRVLGVA